MDNIIPENEYTEFENRVYGNPQIPVDRQNNFIDNLRATQTQQNQEIAQQTQNLGTSVPSNIGGLTGNNSYWTSRYQTPQTNSVLQNLRTTAQAAALNQALENEQAMWKNRYQQAYRNYQKRSWDNSKQTNTQTQTTTGNVNYNDNSDGHKTEDNGGTVTSEGLAPGASRLAYSMNGYIYTQDTLANGRKVMSNTDDPEYVQADDGYFYKVPTTDSWGPFTWGLSDSDRKNRANKIAKEEAAKWVQTGGHGR